MHYLWLATLLLSSCYALAQPTHDSSQHEAKSDNGAVASESAVCSKIGIELLKKGGNAADALVGTVFCVGTIGIIGGGGFMLVRSKTGTYEFIDFRETAPAAAFQEMYSQNINLSIYGGLASGIPGEIRGLEHLHKNYGKLSWRKVLEPAIKVARFGFPVTKDTVRYIQSATSTGSNFLRDDPAWAIDFAPNGTVVGLGDILTRKRYADTLETISLHGADAFYTGAIANATITALRKANGTMTLDDLENYTVAIRDPVSIKYKDYTLHACSAPSGGVVALAALNTFNGYNTSDPSQINLTTHRLVESMKWAYGERTQLGDPSFASNITAFEANMLTQETATEIRAKIKDSSTFTTSYYDPQGIQSLNDSGTSHIVAADKDGMAITLTTTVNLLFGSHLIVPETGVIMNNEMNDFSVPGASNAFGYIPSVANYIKPGKRPLSSISPVIAETSDGKLYLAVGSAGGSRIITATIQNIHHVLDEGKTPAQALASPRLHDQLTPATIYFEWTGLNIQGYSNATTAYLKSIGHNITFEAPGGSTAQALRGCRMVRLRQLVSRDSMLVVDLHSRGSGDVSYM